MVSSKATQWEKCFPPSGEKQIPLASQQCSSDSSSFEKSKPPKASMCNIAEENHRCFMHRHNSFIRPHNYPNLISKCTRCYVLYHGTWTICWVMWCLAWAFFCVLPASMVLFSQGLWPFSLWLSVLLWCLCFIYSIWQAAQHLHTACQKPPMKQA